MLYLKNIFIVIPHEATPHPCSDHIHADLTQHRLFCPPPRCLCLSRGVCVVPLTPLRTPVSTMIPVMSSRSTEATPANTASSANPGGVTLPVLLVKAVITPRVPNPLSSIGSPTTASAGFPFPCRVESCQTLSNKPD